MTALVPLPFDDPRAVQALAAYQAEMDERYPGHEPSGAAVDDFLGPVGLFLVGLDDDGRPVACGGLRPQSVGGQDGGELKKVWVAREARGTGLGRGLVRALTEHARAQGLPRLVLQTGLEQPEAIRLYESEGWTPIPVYGQYADDPRCRCYELPL